MNGQTAKASRRELRKAFGDRALGTLDQQTRAISSAVVSAQAHEQRLCAIEDGRRRDRADIETALGYTRMSFWRRWRWLLTGR